MRWCDLSCPEAGFPKEDAVDGAGSCRTFAALYCAKLGRLVAKNAPCAAEAMAHGEKDGKGGDQG
ncbi:MAG: hypothetical protein KMY53_19935 [Desulfarculus sp.]|nr:hypothetical protein [Pseudomonadota bacterium]MBV1717790.1 hypothetical protein [Desulfarculus sp.]MBU4575991.1 hypothetical protein [Pseudomonadota bacterium]MBU4596788.1 hypothetical protein [Pseudomonadota bacterium]MBV1740444.1 hypothetical protein [Desulfarculus sp.]